MPIHTPGEKFRYHRILRKHKSKREVVALLSLTAMVDMFTVLVIFLLQNFDSKEFIVYTPKELQLPKAMQIKELKPAVVVTISAKELLVDKTKILSFEEIQAQKEWMIQPLFTQVTEALKKAKDDQEKNLQKKLRDAVDSARGQKEEVLNAWNKVTIQADKGIDFLTVKKVMYTVTEAGAGEINFAVAKKNDNE